MKRSRVLLLLALCLSSVSLLAQATTATLIGNVTSEGSPLPGVTVSLTSPSLQGTRTTVSGDGGAYTFAAVPPGVYTVRFELDGMQPVTKQVLLSLAQTTRADAGLQVSALTDVVTVVGTRAAVLESNEITTNFDKETIEELPTGRTVTDAVLLSAGVNNSGPNNQIQISGGQSMENLFLINGVVVNENLRGQPHNLFIEDAIQETTILTGGISAEYGRFTGGVVSSLTKSGGNEFTGSLRDSLTNDSWTKKSDFAAQVDPADKLNEVYEATLGGRIIRDRLWFFTAGRMEERETRGQTTFTNIPYPQTREDERWEAKLTGQISQNHTLVGSYLDNQTERTGVINGSVVDLASVTTRTEPNTLMAASYNGILTNNFLLEGQYSEMNFSFQQGAETRDPILGTMIRDTATGRRAFSPTFCGKACPPKERNNKEYLAKASYFLSTRATGSHSFTAGYDDFHQLRNENNYQSGSDFRIFGDFIYVGNQVFFRANPENGQIEWDPVPALSKTSDFATRSYFLNDEWNLSPRLSFNIGVRYDEAYGTDQAGKKTVDDNAISPRLRGTWDLAGNGRHRFSASYGKYVSKVDQGPADLTATAGRYASYYWDYRGPLINGPGTPTSELLPTAEVIKRVFEWFNSVGGTKNTQYLNSTHIPGVTTKFEGSLKAPSMDEYTVGYGMAVGSTGFVRGDVISRDWKDFYVVRRTMQTGKATDPNGTVVDVGIIENSSDNLEREYFGVQLQGSYRFGRSFSVGGNYTWAELEGNVVGESANFATTLTDNNNYPEYTGFARNNPTGYLEGDIRHRGNLWLQYDLPTGIGDFNVSLLQRYHSGLPYSASATIDVRRGTATGPANGVANPGYQIPPSAVTYFFSERGEFRLDDITSTDLALNYLLPLGKVKLFVQGDLLNAFNEQGIEDPDFVLTTVRTRRNGATISGARMAAFDPRTETPREFVIGVSNPADGVYNFVKDVNFGKPTSASAYQLPRTYRVSFGVRF